MQTQEPPSALENHLGYWLRCLSNFVSDHFEKKLNTFEISVAQWVVLRILFDHEGVLLHQAAELVGVDKSSLSRMIERLVQRGLVIRTVGHDRRAVNLKLTKEGQELVPKLAQLADENDMNFFKALSTEERQRLLESMKKLLTDNNWQLSVRGADRMK